jgi:hypothetical protein
MDGDLNDGPDILILDPSTLHGSIAADRNPLGTDLDIRPQELRVLNWLQPVKQRQIEHPDFGPERSARVFLRFLNIPMQFPQTLVHEFSFSFACFKASSAALRHLCNVETPIPKVFAICG